MDQNSNMGGFSPMPGQAGVAGRNGVPASPAMASGAAAMPITGVMPNAPQAGAIPNNVPGMPGAQNAAVAANNKSSLMSTLALVGVCLVAAVAIVFAVIFFMQYNELSTNFDTEKESAIAKAVADQQQADTEKFAEESKLPYEKFTGPSDYGSISFEYPKTWSLYVKSDGSNNSDLETYFHPKQIDSIDDGGSRYALRFRILNQQITTVQKDYDSMLENGDVTSSVFNGDNNKISGTKYVGTIGEGMNGIVVIFKVNDKTAVLQTDAMIYQNDFETLLSKLRRNS